MRQDGSPSAIPAEMFRSLINVRFSGGGLTERGGQSKLNNDALLGCITGIIPGDATPVSVSEVIIFSGLDQDPDVNPGTCILSTYDPDNGFVTPYPQQGGADHGRTMSYIAGSLPLGAGGALVRGFGRSISDIAYQAPTVMDDQFNDDAGTDPGDFYAYTMYGGGDDRTSVGGFAEFQGQQYGLMADDLNGVCERRVQKTGVGATGLIADVVRTFSDPAMDVMTSPFLIHYQAEAELCAALQEDVLHVMDVNLVWRTVAMPAGCGISLEHTASAAEYDGILYFTGFGPGGGWLLYAYNGVDIVPAHSVAGSPPTYQPLVVFRSALYYGNNVGGAANLGKYDGTTFDDSVFTFSGAAEVIQLLVAYEKLYALRGSQLLEASDPDDAWTSLSTEADAFVTGATYPSLDD